MHKGLIEEIQTRCSCMQKKTLLFLRSDSCSGLYRGPTGTLLNELADASFDAASCEIVYVSL